MSTGPAREGCSLCGADGGTCCCHHHDDGGNFFTVQRHDEAPAPPVEFFQFFGHEGFGDQPESVTWLFDDPLPLPQDRSSSSSTAGHQQQQPLEYDVLPSYLGTNGGGLTFEISLKQPTFNVDAGLELGEGVGGSRHTQAAASATIMSYCGSTFTDAASSTLKEKAMADGESLNRNMVADPTMEKEAKVMRYKMKRKRRCYEKQIRYASKKAFAEMRPRVKGRFANVPKAARQPFLPPSTYDPNATSRLEL